MLLVAERSGLLLDPQPDTFFLMDIAVERMVPLSESLAVVRGQGAAILVRGDASTTERVQILGRMDRCRASWPTCVRIEALQRAGTPPPAWAAARRRRRLRPACAQVFAAEAMKATRRRILRPRQRRHRPRWRSNRQLLSTLEGRWQRAQTGAAARCGCRWA